MSSSSPNQAATCRRRSAACLWRSCADATWSCARSTTSASTAHQLLSGSGTTRSIVCPYHAWVYGLDGELCGARRTETMVSFDKSEICLDPVQVKQFGGLVFINLDPTAAPLAEQAPDIAAEMEQWAPDVATLTPARMTTSPTTSPRRR